MVVPPIYEVDRISPVEHYVLCMHKLVEYIQKIFVLSANTTLQRNKMKLRKIKQHVQVHRS